MGIYQLEMTRVGGKLAVVLPEEAISRLNVVSGESLYLTETPDGYRLTAADADLAEQMAIGLEVMEEYRDALRDLAK
ncbi:AbrB family transcriptional regulator [Caenispirillum bisanense]|uniref:AbrB family transcriptional regulator n=1 Tax=Caenispirillum bisanense TaxID=414052 RepID=UPI0031E11BB7